MNEPREDGSVIYAVYGNPDNGLGEQRFWFPGKKQARKFARDLREGKPHGRRWVTVRLVKETISVKVLDF